MADVSGESMDVTGGFAEVREVLSRSQVFQTPCGAGQMVWHRWGDGPPLMMLHGGSGSWLHWLRTIPALEKNHTIWAADLPGMGDSALPPEPYLAHDYADIVMRGFLSLVPGAGLIDVVGFSFGTGLSARIGCQYPGKIRHLVLSGASFYPPVPIPKRENFMSFRRASTDEERRRVVKNNLMVMMIRHEKNADALAQHLYDVDTRRRTLPRVSFSGFQTLRVDLQALTVAGRITAISGADDQIIGRTPEGHREQLLSVRPDASYHAIPGAGHWVMYEGAAGYNSALIEALA